MRITQQVHVMDNETTFSVGRLWDTIEEAPGFGHNTIVVKVGAPALGWDVTLFIDGDDATLFRLQGQLHDLADQVEELISPDAMIVADQVVGQAEAVKAVDQDGEGM